LIAPKKHQGSSTNRSEQAADGYGAFDSRILSGPSRHRRRIRPGNQHADSHANPHGG
jgi:hypothetical protein